jgi:ABC-type Mn2+/Zn2+ transport system ATPase subunit
LSHAGETAVAVHELSVAFGPRRALEAISFAVPSGSLAGVLGPNGAGKTTLLRALLEDLPHAGRASIAGATAYVPQLGAVDASFPVDALGVVLMGRYPRLGWRRRPGAADRLAAREILERLGLAERERSAYGELSGGLRQRALIGRALAQEADVLLLDEPLTGVDAPSQEVILAVLEEECRAGRTVMLTTHDLALAARVCDRLLLLNRRLVAMGAPDEVLRAEVLRQAYGRELMVVGQDLVVVDDAHHHGAEP